MLEIIKTLGLVSQPMQILHPFAGSLQHYEAELAAPDRYRPDHCPQCEAKHPLTAHGFYTRTLADTVKDSIVRVRRYLCQSCKRTVSLLPQFCLPYLRSSITVIALFLIARLLHQQTLKPPLMPPSNRGCPTSAASSGFAVSWGKPNGCVPRWPA